MRQAEPICSPRLLEVLASKVHQHLGMDFSGPRRAELLRRLRQLAVEQERDPAAWLESLAFAEWDDAQIQALIPAFSVGETYFRRDAEALDWLARQHLAPLLQRRRAAGHKYLRVWSAACCTGEEAYSLLFLLDELLGTEAASWKLELLASDINAGFLARAEQGRYGQNAFRRNDEAFRSRHFLAEDRTWRVRLEWRGRIRFLRHNLADQALPNPSRGLAAVDLILCRNVLMYFSAEHAAAALRRLLACLSEDGILVLSAVEAGLATQAGLSGFWAGSNYALAAGAAEQQTAPIPVVPVAPTPRALPELKIATPPIPEPIANAAPQIERSSLWCDAEAALAQGRMERARELLHTYLAQPGLAVAQRYDACLLMARSWADQQRSGEAREWLQRALDLDAAALPAYWLQALLARQEGDVPAALQALHKALYLDPDCSMLHFQQGLLLREAGRRQPGDKALRVCLRLLQSSAVETPVALGDGLSAGQLRQLCEQLLEGRRMSEPGNVEERWTQLRERLADFERRIDQEFAPDPGEHQERLLQRTREWARSVEEARPDSLIELLSFTLGEELYAIETGHVGAVLPLPHFTPLPGTPPFVLGIVNVRGHIVSVLDLRVFFELPIEGLSDKNYLVVLRNQEMEFGLLADRIRGIEQIPRDSLQPGLANLTGIRANYLLGVTAEQTTVLDGSRLLGDPNLRVHADD